MLEKYLDVSKLTAATINAINIDDERSYIFKHAVASYATIRLRLQNVANANKSGDVELDWDRPFAQADETIDDMVDGILRTLITECSTARRAAVYFYHRIYGSIAAKRDLAEKGLGNGLKPEHYDELIRLVFVGIVEEFA